MSKSPHRAPFWRRPSAAPPPGPGVDLAQDCTPPTLRNDLPLDGKTLADAYSHSLRPRDLADATSDGSPLSEQDWSGVLPPMELSHDEMLDAFPLPTDGRYIPVAFLGDGGMGRVYKAFDKKLKRTVAMKFMRHLAPGSLERFLQEGRAQAQIEHPNVVSIYSVGQVDSQPYLSMRYIDGPNLRAALPQLNLEQKVRILKDVAEALQACHRLGIIHRDVKPTNIMLESTEKGIWWPFVMDFGLARDMESTSLTVTGVIVGTPAYCSPEQVQGHLGEIDRRSDVYSLGATLYECICGEAPFSPKAGLVDLVQQIVDTDPIPPSRRVPNLPKDLETIALKALEKDPARRYDSAKAMADDLKRYLDGDPIVARASSLVYRVGKRVRKNKPLTLAMIGSLVVVLGLVGFGLVAMLKVRTMAASAQRFSRMAEQVEALLFRSHSMPLHDITLDRNQAEQRMVAIRHDMLRLGRWSEPAGHLALGRCLLALGRPAEALPELEKAWKATKGKDPEVAQALGLALSHLYLMEIEHLR
ncbi:MAG: serine/threonine-protein kinase, partial [Holophaga sp.]|nr:serine/threonine-protein kinase [Holophaga sp.]